jgi:glycosyltransferase involved in cell wall biosynthesis
MSRALLYVVPDARFFVTHRLVLALAARDAGYEVHVATPDGPEVEKIRTAGLPWHRVRFGPMRRKPWSDLQSLFDVIRLYRRLRPALAHHVSFKAVLYGTIAARLARVRGVVNAMTGMGDVFAAHSFSDRIWRSIIIMLFRIFVRHERMIVIAQNVEDVDLMISVGVIRREQVRLIRGSGVDPDSFVRAKRKTEIPVVAFVGRAIETKGIIEFAAAARRLREQGVRARFVVAGARDDGSGKVIPNRIFDDWISRGDIEYLGLRDDAREIYAVADIVCLPSWGGEGVPKVLIEAASCELPIVTTDVPGCHDIVRNGENGLLVAPHTVEPLAEAIRKLVDDPALRAQMGARGRQIVKEEFSLRRVVDSTLDVYAELIGPANAGSFRDRAPASGG